MNLGTDTGTYRGLSREEALTRLAGIGWTDVQISSGHLDDVRGDDVALADVRATCGRLGVTVRQVHSDAELGPTTDDLDANLRWLDITAAIGADCLITHANGDADYNTEAERQRCLALNRDCLSTVAERADALGVRVAIENRLERPWATCRRFGARMQDFLDLIEAADAPGVGICLDTSHTRVARLSFADEIALAGPRLFATQLSDSDGQTQHRMPFTLDIAWEEVITSLKAVGYDGLLTLDCGSTDASPDALDAQLFAVAERFALLLNDRGT